MAGGGRRASARGTSRRPAWRRCRSRFGAPAGGDRGQQTRRRGAGALVRRRELAKAARHVDEVLGAPLARMIGPGTGVREEPGVLIQADQLADLPPGLVLEFLRSDLADDLVPKVASGPRRAHPRHDRNCRHHRCQKSRHLRIPLTGLYRRTSSQTSRGFPDMRRLRALRSLLRRVARSAPSRRRNTRSPGGPTSTRLQPATVQLRRLGPPAPDP